MSPLPPTTRRPSRCGRPCSRAQSGSRCRSRSPGAPSTGWSHRRGAHRTAGPRVCCAAAATSRRGTTPARWPDCCSRRAPGTGATPAAPARGGYGDRMTIPPSGEQFEIRAGGQRATIVEVGGGLREYEVDGRPVFEPYPVERMRDGAHGAPLIPWPNRLADGRYSFDGENHQLALTEPERHNAIHGLLLWRPWRVDDRAADRLVIGARLRPLPGFPF